MKKILNPIPFQGKKYLNKNKNYFEGWYFKITNQENGIAFIPGIQIEKMQKTSFIQIITKEKSYYITYPIETFEYKKNPFQIKVGHSIFSKEKIEININEENIKINGTIFLKEKENIMTSIVNPNIMGPFSYIPHMECNHAILSMQTLTNGEISIQDETLNFQNNNGYIEKDWGTSFPQNYIWLEGNQFQNKTTSFFLAIATIPYLCLKFKGLICVLIINHKEYRFATYNNTKIKELKHKKGKIYITLKKGKYTLKVEAKEKNTNNLKAPKHGKMNKEILESINSSIYIELKEKGKIIYKDKSNLCGLENVQ